MKKLVWSEVEVEGGKPYSGRLPALPSATGRLQSMAKAPDSDQLLGTEKPTPPPEANGDVRVLALPIAPADALPIPTSYIMPMMCRNQTANLFVIMFALRGRGE